MVLLVVGNGLADVGLVDNLGVEARPAAGDVACQGFVVEGFAYADGMVMDL